MRRSDWLLVSVALLSCAPEAPIQIDPAEELSGGETTVFDTTREAYSYSARNLGFDLRQDFLVGNNFFGDNWVIAPSSVDVRDGLGPLYNALSCSSCHFKDGRGRPPTDDEEMVSTLVRLSIPGEDEHGGPLGDPVYGGQLQPRAIPGVPPEARTHTTWPETAGTYADGTPYSLRRPVVELTELGYGPMADGIMTSMRVAPAVYGLGLLEALREEDIVARADPDDADGDGISGRPNYVWDPVTSTRALGRFGWKANQANLRSQTTGAFLGDIGISTYLSPLQNCSSAQTECNEAITGGDPELETEFVDFVVFYGQTLAVPARRDFQDPTVVRGRALFRAIGCADCHVPEMTTGEHEIAQLSHQRIWPYTDLLLHDMGEELADHRPDYEASGTEWRTPPLWGIGLLETVNRHEYLLHDGRARGLAEAILWHGGEAEAAREAFRSMGANERDDLLAFLRSL